MIIVKNLTRVFLIYLKKSSPVIKFIVEFPFVKFNFGKKKFQNVFKLP